MYSSSKALKLPCQIQEMCCQLAKRIVTGTTAVEGKILGNKKMVNWLGSQLAVSFFQLKIFCNSVVLSTGTVPKCSSFETRFLLPCRLKLLAVFTLPMYVPVFLHLPHV